MPCESRTAANINIEAGATEPSTDDIVCNLFETIKNWMISIEADADVESIKRNIAVDGFYNVEKRLHSSIDSKYNSRHE